MCLQSYNNLRNIKQIYKAMLHRFQWGNSGSCILSPSDSLRSQATHVDYDWWAQRSKAVCEVLDIGIMPDRFYGTVGFEGSLILCL